MTTTTARPFNEQEEIIRKIRFLELEIKFKVELLNELKAKRKANSFNQAIPDDDFVYINTVNKSVFAEANIILPTGKTV